MAQFFIVIIQQTLQICLYTHCTLRALIYKWKLIKIYAVYLRLDAMILNMY